MAVLHLSACRFDKVFEHGRSLPMLISAEAPGGKQHEAVLKLREPGRLTALHLISELVASLLARDLGLRAPEPYIVEVTPEFAASVPNPDARHRLLAAPGLHFASQHVTGQFHLPLNQVHLPHAAIDPAAAVLAFDLLTGNDDRHREKANCLVRGQEVVIIDHERAFPVVRQEIGPVAWQAGGLSKLRNHVFHDALKGQLPDFTLFCDHLSRLGIEQIEGYLSCIPAVWDDGAAVARLREFILDLLRHHSRVIVSIQEELR